MEKYNKSCLTGMISCITSENKKFITYYQDVEYISGQMFWRNMENSRFFGSVSCAPGAFTIIKFSSIEQVAAEYFADKEYKDSFDYQRFYLGEDRYLTHLLMENEPWKLGYCQYARCKTDAPDNMAALLKQRRRWYLGHIANDTWMVGSWKMWKTYPLFSIFNLLNNTRNTSMYVYLLYFVLLLNKEVPLLLWILFIILPIALNWLFLIVYSFTIRRKMNIIFYIAIIVLQPLVSMMFMYYTLWTIRQKGWGGVRDAKQNKDSTSEMIEVVVQS